VVTTSPELGGGGRGGLPDAGFTVKVTIFEVAAGEGLYTTILAVPVDAISVAGMVAASSVEERYMVVRSVPFQRTFEPDMKPDPVTLRVNWDPPAFVDAGLKVVMTGRGMLVVKVTASETAPSGFSTVTVAVP
jgi:hypothetical protein